jgi:hypothetical protein
LSFGKNPYYLFSKDKLTPKDEVQKRVTRVLDAIGIGDNILLSHSVNALQAIITPRLADTNFMNEMMELEEQIEEDNRKQEQEYAEKMKGAVCGGLVPKPDKQPSREFLLKKFQSIWYLVERRGMGFDSYKEEIL